MKSRLALGAALLALSTSLIVPSLAEAKRLGGGGSAGMQRQLPPRTPQQTPPQTPPQQAAPTPAQNPAVAPAAAGATGAAAAAGKRSWLGPIAGIAAGLGIAALLSHLGFGEGLATFVTLLLMAAVAFFVIRWLLRLSAARPVQRSALAGAAAGAGSAAPTTYAPQVPKPATPAPAAYTGSGSDVSVTGQPLPRLQPGSAVDAAPPAVALPAGFDQAGFERIAKMFFIRMQAANDSADLEDLRRFTTPEFFAAARLEIQERGGVAQHTDVEHVEAQIIDFADEAARQVVSVRYQGRVREEAGAAAQAFDEVWHLVKPAGDASAWAVAGIQQPQ